MCTNMASVILLQIYPLNMSYDNDWILGLIFIPAWRLLTFCPIGMINLL